MNAASPSPGWSAGPERPGKHLRKRGHRSVLVAAATAWLIGAVIFAGCGTGSTGTAPLTSQAAAPSATTKAASSTVAAADDEDSAAEELTETPSAAGEVVRVVGVVDGDTLRVSGVDGVTERLRIIGIDAPELSGNECYAQQSASRMQSLVQSKDVRIVADPTQDDRDRYDRILRHVWTLDGRNVALELVAAGLAKEYTYSRPYAGQAEYRDAEASALRQSLGLWGACDGSNVIAAPVPSPTAAAPFAPQPAAPDAAGQCVIKGNINRAGEKIYHVPSGRSYDDTIIDEGKGERWFCSEQEAVDAGWRRAKR